jgi:phage tail-like protein
MATAPAHTFGRRLISKLPEIYRDPSFAEEIRLGRPEGRQDFLRLFLGAVERVLLGPSSGTMPALEERILGLYHLLIPDETPADFLDWLSDWVGLSRRLDISAEATRNLVAVAVPLYARRGTPDYICTMLRLALGVDATIREIDKPAMQLEYRSVIGRDTWIGGGPPHSFLVTISAPTYDTAKDVQAATGEVVRTKVQDLLDRVKTVIDLARPAHTSYEVTINETCLVIGRSSIIGIHTMLAGPRQHGR